MDYDIRVFSERSTTVVIPSAARFGRSRGTPMPAMTLLAGCPILSPVLRKGGNEYFRNCFFPHPGDET
jgi:hypothetical protein